MLLIVFLIGLSICSALFTVFLFLNEKKLEKIKSIHERKKMYKNALFVSMFIIIFGALFYIIGLYINRMDVTFFGWIFISGGFIGGIYSLIGFYKSVSA
jgi:hypothetical protein